MTDWLKKCRAVHGIDYDYSIPFNASIDTKIQIYCKQHGWFTQTLRAHVYRKCKCPHCAKQNKKQKRLKSSEYYIKKAQTIHDNFYQYPDWINLKLNYKQKVRIICPIHGEFFQTVANHLTGSGCPQCGKIHQIKNKRKSSSYFIKKAIETHGNKYDYSLVHQHTNSSKDLITFVCPKHGKFKQTWATHIDKRAGCPQCSKEKTKITTFNRYGVPHVSQSHYSEKTIQLLNNKQWLESQHIHEKKTLEEIAEQLNIQDTTVGKYFKKYNIDVVRFPISFAEKQISNFLKQHDIDHKTNVRNLIPGYEVDIFIPTHNIAIEYCGLYWHSELFKHPNYHKQKMLQCEKNNIRLLTIFSDEWLYKQQIVKNKILHILHKSQQRKIFARCCTIKRISHQQKNDFLNVYHIEGSDDNINSINYGLLFENQLVAIMCFIQQQNQFILNRYATSQRVIGGFTKLLNYFSKNYHWKQIVTFVDLRWDKGDLFLKNHFSIDEILQPNYFYIKNQRRFSKSEFKQQTNGLRIWDCGKIRFVLNIN